MELSLKHKVTVLEGPRAREMLVEAKSSRPARSCPGLTSVVRHLAPVFYMQLTLIWEGILQVETGLWLYRNIQSWLDSWRRNSFYIRIQIVETKKKNMFAV